MPGRDNKTILVTGASGSIGRYVVPALTSAGWTVRAQYARRPLSDVRADWRRWDFLSDEAPDALVEGCYAVVHLAAEITRPELMPRLNVATTVALALASERAGVGEFCHASSIVVYGSPAHPNVDERTPLLDPYQPMLEQYRAEPYMLEYARTKALAERGLQELALGMRVTVMRPSVVVDHSAIAACAQWSLGRKLLFAGRNTQFIYVGDVAAAIVYLLARAGTKGQEAFNIVDESSETYGALFARLRQPTLRSALTRNFHLPTTVDLVKDMVKHRSMAARYPLGRIQFSNATLRATGFTLPTGMVRAADASIRTQAG